MVRYWQRESIDAPVYQWRAIKGERYSGPWASEAEARRRGVVSFSGGRFDVERRTAPGKWERVEEGTER